MEKRPLWMGRKTWLPKGREMILTEKEQQAKKMVCHPLDGLATMDEARARVEELSPVVGLFKVGKESYTRFGPAIVKMVQDYGANVFLDLKYHDIPNTVREAAIAATELGVYMFNVHASGAGPMLLAAAEGANEGAVKYGVEKPKVIGVTVLTSLDKNLLNHHGRVPGSVEDHVLHLAQISHSAGLEGIVCSGADLKVIKDKLPSIFMYIIPGIKGPNTPAGDDQKRVFTPGNAIRDGATMLVIGRAISKQKTSDERIQVGYDILKDMARYL